MLEPNPPLNEVERLAELRELRILDTDPEPGFDRAAALAASIAGTPIALVSLVDEERQWFKSNHGLDARETPRAVSFCGHVVATGARLVVEDARVDERFADNPLVTGAPFVTFYAGVPLITPEGHTLGTLCVIDHAPRRLSAAQLVQLELVAENVVRLLEARRAHLVLTREREAAIDAERRLAALFATMNDGVVVQGFDGEILAANPAAERILGLTLDQLQGRRSVDPRWQAIHPDGRPFPGEEHPAMVALHTGEPVRGVRMGVRTPDGAMRWILVNAEPLLRPDEPSYAVVTTFTDVTPIA